jgi:hypothetical protein
MTEIKLTIKGIEVLQSLLRQFPKEIGNTLSAAGREAAEKIILPTEGIRKYPPADAANAPGRYKTVTINGRPATFRQGYYIRGRGFQSPTRGGGYRNLANSERYGTQWYVKRNGYGTEIGNRASYAKWLGGEEQARHMAARGWRRLIDVALEKLPEITAVYQKWVDDLIAKLTHGNER